MFNFCDCIPCVHAMCYLSILLLTDTWAVSPVGYCHDAACQHCEQVPVPASLFSFWRCTEGAELPGTARSGDGNSSSNS